MTYRTKKQRMHWCVGVLMICSLVVVAAPAMATNHIEGGTTIVVEVGDIQVIQTEGDWSVDNQNFIPVGHLEFSTADVFETANSLNPFDLVIKVSGMPVGGLVTIAFDKHATNNTNVTWSDFHMELGTGVGPGFVLSDEIDQLAFVPPAPIEMNGFFPVFTSDEPLPTGPDVLWYFGSLAPGETAVWWLAIQVPDDIDGVIDGMATFTLRQQPTVAAPEPAALSLLAFGACGLLLRRRRRRRR